MSKMFKIFMGPDMLMKLDKYHFNVLLYRVFYTNTFKCESFIPNLYYQYLTLDISIAIIMSSLKTTVIYVCQSIYLCFFQILQLI